MCGCNSTTTLTSTKGEKGDTGATGPVGVSTPFNLNPGGSGTDIYAAGAGLNMVVLPTKTGNGTLNYNGVVNVDATDVGLLTLTPKNNSTGVSGNIVRATYPPAVGGLSYISVPISGTMSMNDGEQFIINVLGPSGTSPKLLNANFRFTQS